MKLEIKGLIFLFAVFVLSGCQSELKPVELDILGTVSCQPHCWRGIVPGETTAEETIKIFQGWQADGKGTWKRNTGNKGTLYWDYVCWLEEVWPEICLRVDDNIVSEIDLRVSSPSSLQLSDIIDNFGYPDGYTLVLCTDCANYGIELFYPDRGLIFSASSSWLIRLKNRDAEGPVVSPEMKITRALFIRQITRNEMLEFAFGNNFDIQFILKNYHHWNGYGRIPESIP